MELWLAPLRGVTIRAFREVFLGPLVDAGFAGAVAPFIPANPGIRVTDRMLSDLVPGENGPDGGATPRIALVPQVITRHPDAMRTLLRGFRAAGFDCADLNAGCPFPMIVRRGRGAGLFKDPALLESLLAAGCEEMGPGRFSLKIRLGLEKPDELLALMPMINRYPLAFISVHARTARQRYEGNVDVDAFRAVCEVSSNPVLFNGDVDIESLPDARNLPGLELIRGFMIGRSFIRGLGRRVDAVELLSRYVDRSCAELPGDRPVLGRVKELVSYWRESPVWRRLWPLLKVCSSVAELRMLFKRGCHVR